MIPATPHDSRRRRWVPWAVAAAVLVLLAMLSPQFSHEIALHPHEVGMVDLHGLELEEETRTVRSGRGDPHFELILPWWARPVTELTLMVEPIWGNVGVFQFYYLPPDPVEPFFRGEWRTDLDVALYGGAEPLVVPFPEPADRIRVDPTHGAEFVIQSVRVRAWPGRHPVITTTALWLAMACALIASFIGWREPWRRGIRWVASRPRGLIIVVLIALILVRLWLTATQPLKAVGGALHDDQLFIDQAASIVEGNWLGAYDHLTLVKGQGYPLWIAAMFLLGIPLVFSQHLLYVLAAAGGYLAWRPAFSAGWRLIIVAVVLFNPASFHGDDSGRVLRNHFCASLALLTFVLAIGWWLRCRLPWRRQLGWAAGTGAAFGLLWLTREEVVWMVGVLVLLAVAAGWTLRRDGPAAWGRAAAVGLVPIGVWSLMVMTISLLNFVHYGFWGTVEARARPFKDAYGALSRIEVGPWRQYVPVSREMREAAYEVSPAFRRVQPFLEGELGEGWASLGEWQTGLPPSERQIHGAGFMWALRDGAAAAGEHLSARRAMEFYRRMADEINGACDDGRLPALGSRSGFMPPWRSEYNSQVPPVYFEAWRFITTFAHVVPRPPPSSGTDESLEVYRDLARTTLSPRPEDPPLPPRTKRMEDFKNGVMKDVTRVYAFLTPGAVLVVLGLWVALWWRMLRWRREALLVGTVLATAALAGAAAITLVVTLIHVTSFTAITIGYQAAAYPLMLLFVVFTLATLATAPATARQSCTERPNNSNLAPTLQGASAPGALRTPSRTPSKV